MTGDVRVPEERICEECGRHEVWDASAETWRVDDEVGEVYCIHSWDITGTFQPVEK